MDWGVGGTATVLESVDSSIPRAALWSMKFIGSESSAGVGAGGTQGEAPEGLKGKRKKAKGRG